MKIIPKKRVNKMKRPFETDCSKCLFIREIDKNKNWWGCSNSRHFSLHIKRNKKGNWVTVVYNKRKKKDFWYSIGDCKGFIKKTPEKTKKYIDFIMKEIGVGNNGA